MIISALFGSSETRYEDLPDTSIANRVEQGEI
jgi:hypothetical protein